MSPTQHLPIENQTTTKVSLGVQNEQIEEVISLLVAKQIPFEVCFTHKNKASSQLLLQESPKTVYRALSPYTVAENIYHKYIDGGFESPIPTEIEIANEFNLSIGIFRKVFKKKYGSTFLHLYMTKRMEKAQELLRQGLSCRDVARQVGYGPHSDIKFNKMFQKHFGITPKKYQLLEAFK